MVLQPHLSRAVARGLAAGILLHTAAVAWIWSTQKTGVSSISLVWVDFPVSLFYLGAGGRWVLIASLVIGGLEWAILGALLTYGVGRLTARTQS